MPIPTTRRALVRAGAWSAPAVMVAATAPAAAAASPPPAYLSVSGAIGALQARPNFQWTWSFTLDSITIANNGPAIDPGRLYLRIRFQGNEMKAPNLQVNELRHPASDSWDGLTLATSGAGPHAELVYYNAAQIPADTTVTFSSLSLQTPETSFPQPGTLIVAVSSTGRTVTAPLTLEVPTDRRVDFHPGTSRLGTVNGRSAIGFEGASISVVGPDPLVGADFLRLRIRFIPDQSTSSELLDLYPARAQGGAVPNGALTWTPEFGSLPDAILEWSAELTRRDGTTATIPLADGDWVGVGQSVTNLPGQFWVEVWADQRNDFWWDRWVLISP
ncbi:hypothetical protein [Nocardioides bigeumensis]